jgi:uncharacterized membrane protein YukC
MMKKWHWFQYILNGVGILFFGIMIYVTYIAFSRSTGSLGLDMAKIHQKREDFYKKRQAGDIADK